MWSALDAFKIEAARALLAFPNRFKPFSSRPVQGDSLHLYRRKYPSWLRYGWLISLPFPLLCMRACRWPVNALLRFHSQLVFCISFVVDSVLKYIFFAATVHVNKNRGVKATIGRWTESSIPKQLLCIILKMLLIKRVGDLCCINYLLTSVRLYEYNWSLWRSFSLSSHVGNASRSLQVL